MELDGKLYITVLAHIWLYLSAICSCNGEYMEDFNGFTHLKKEVVILEISRKFARLNKNHGNARIFFVCVCVCNCHS